MSTSLRRTLSTSTAEKPSRHATAKVFHGYDEKVHKATFADETAHQRFIFQFVEYKRLGASTPERSFAKNFASRLLAFGVFVKLLRCVICIYVTDSWVELAEQSRSKPKAGTIHKADRIATMNLEGCIAHQSSNPKFFLEFRAYAVLLRIAGSKPCLLDRSSCDSAHRNDLRASFAVGTPGLRPVLVRFSSSDMSQGSSARSIYLLASVFGTLSNGDILVLGHTRHLLTGGRPCWLNHGSFSYSSSLSFNSSALLARSFCICDV
ncbi:hypothetical protein KCU90_g194, partial [Aureobasidium melanogenum]